MNKHVRKAFTLIAADEMLKDKHAPDYKLMVNILDEAIEKVHEDKSGTPQFEWLTDQISESVIVRDIPIMSESYHSTEVDIPSESAEDIEIPIRGESDSSDWSVIVNRK